MELKITVIFDTEQELETNLNKAINHLQSVLRIKYHNKDKTVTDIDLEGYTSDEYFKNIYKLEIV